MFSTDQSARFYERPFDVPKQCMCAEENTHDIQDKASLRAPCTVLQTLLDKPNTNTNQLLQNSSQRGISITQYTIILHG